MYPSMVLYWLANNIDPSKEPIEVQTTEPYIVGGHCQAGYWVDKDRRTTLPGLYAAGDVAGGAPYKFVSGCWAEGVMAARAAGSDVSKMGPVQVAEDQITAEEERAFRALKNNGTLRYPVQAAEFEARLQKIMEQYAGGASTYYEMNDEMLSIARQRLAKLPAELDHLVASDLHQLMKVHEVADRVDVAQMLVEHLFYRKETRWPSYQTRTDYPERDDANWLKFVNSRRDPKSGKIEMMTRPYEQVVPGDRYKP
ncbi:MAG TPA: hypothetical protein VFA47_12395, partial [Candidatus Manganitrophaceae bacterium]|nr:hypothetical protein [Candidatus Manganitrophaceae bacterium]